MSNEPERMTANVNEHPKKFLGDWGRELKDSRTQGLKGAAFCDTQKQSQKQ